MNTATKVAIAAAASRLVLTVRALAGKGPSGRFRRRGIHWELDLREGIDFSIYLLGAFEAGSHRAYREALRGRRAPVVLDIGANIGAHALPIAAMVRDAGGVIHAFEPTSWAFTKLVTNIGLNPVLAMNVRPHQAMLVEHDGTACAPSLHSSWPLLGSDSGTDPAHRGALKGTAGAEALTLDAAVRRLGLDRVDLVKLDVDGHEPDVLLGGLASLERFRPPIVMEWTPHLVRKAPAPMVRALEALRSLGYRARHCAGGAEMELDRAVLDGCAPDLGSSNLLLRADESR